MRAPEHPAFADPRLSPRSGDTSPSDIGAKGDTSKPIFSEKPEPISSPQTKVSEIGRHDELAAHTLEIETPRESPPIDKDDAGMPDPPGDGAFDRLNRRFIKNFSEVKEWSGDAFTKVQNAIDPVRPTGQHVEHRPADHARPIQTGHPHSSVDGGSAGAAILATGLLIGHVARLTYRKTAELKEGWNAGNR